MGIDGAGTSKDIEKMNEPLAPPSLVDADRRRLSRRGKQSIEVLVSRGRRVLGGSPTLQAAVSFDMPRIDATLLYGAGFLYPTEQHARDHAKLGGTGFFIGALALGATQAAGQPVFVPFLVSNRHVVWEGNSPVCRINRRDGGATIIDFTPDQWIVHPEADLAIACVFGHVDSARDEFVHVQPDQILAEDGIEKYDLGVGDEVFMVGRFINHQGRKAIRPAVRFGSISMMLEPIRNPAFGRDEISFAVEMKSKAGFSGSPVVVYRTPHTNIADTKTEHTHFWALLGVNWGHILDEEGENTWLNGVVPAWKILELLKSPKLRDAHESADKRLVAHIRDNKTSAMRLTAVSPEPAPPTKAENPTS